MRFAGSQLSNFMDPTNFDAISHSFMEGQARKNISVNNAYGKRDMGQIEADLLRDKGEIEAKVIKARGQAQSAANWGAGISGLAQGIGGGLASRAGNVPTTPAPGQSIPASIQPLNGTPSYLSPNSSPVSLMNYGSVLDQW